MAKRRLDQWARKVVPSTVLLTHNAALMRALDPIDRLVAKQSSEFTDLPPNRLRLRIGLGNRLLFNQPVFLAIGYQRLAELYGRGWADLTSRIVDIGCGCGRLAIPLKRTGFDGTYVGVDVDPEMIAWCREHLASPTMRFEHADVFNSLYNPEGSRDPYHLPVEDASTDVVTSQSLYTHLLADDVRRYTEEAARVLAPGGRMAMTVFCLEHIRSSPEFGGRWTFEHRVGDAFVESRRVPEAAVAYEEAYLVELVREVGFGDVQVERVLPQSWLVATKQPAQNGGPPERHSR